MVARDLKQQEEFICLKSSFLFYVLSIFAYRMTLIHWIGRKIISQMARYSKEHKNLEHTAWFHWKTAYLIVTSGEDQSFPAHPSDALPQGNIGQGTGTMLDYMSFRRRG
jgi:hypothetical protein